MSAIVKSSVNGPPSLITAVPSNNHKIGPLGDAIAARGGAGSGCGEDIKAGDACYIAADGTVMRALEDQTGTTAAVNDVQTMQLNIAGVSGDVSGGTFTIGYKGVYTAALPITESSAALQTAIQALSTVAASNITVSGSFPNYVFTAANTFAGTALDLIEVDSSLITSTGQYATLSMVHTTVGQPVGASGVEQGASRVRGFAPINAKRGQPITLYDACMFMYSDGNLTPGADVFLSGTVPGGLDTVLTLTAANQKPLGFAVDTQRIYFFSIK